MNNQLVVGVDIGGTKTHLVAAHGSHLLAERILQTADWRSTDLAANATALADMVAILCAGQAPAALAIGAHGCDTDLHCRQMQDAVSDKIVCPVLVVNDCELLVPAAGFSNGIGVVSGTGSIAVARSADGRMLAAGGWGWLGGDEGTAPTHGRHARRAGRSALDPGQHDDPLIPMLLAALGLEDPIKLGRRLHEMGDGVAWGRHAPVVFEAAEAGSAVASAVIDHAGDALASLVSILIERGADATHVVAGGGVIAQQPRLMQAFRTAMATRNPSSHTLLLQAAPVQGALALARRLTTTDPIH